MRDQLVFRNLSYMDKGIWMKGKWMFFLLSFFLHQNKKFKKKKKNQPNKKTPKTPERKLKRKLTGEMMRLG